MNTVFKAALIAASLTVMSAPAFAQDYNRDNRGGYQADRGFVREGFDLFQRIDRLQDRLERGRATGQINRREARRAQDELRDIRRDLTRATSGRARLSPAEHRRFGNRIDRVGGFLRDARDDDRYGRPQHYRG